MKYIVTLWKDSFTYDGLFSDFYILYESSSKDEALKQVPVLWQEEATKELKSNPSYFPMAVADYKMPGCGIAPRKPPNAKNKVIRSVRRKSGDGTGYNSTYFYFEVVELPDDATLSPEIFEDCYEVWDYFGKGSEWFQRGVRTV